MSKKFVISFVVENVSKMTEYGSHSPKVEHFNVPWGVRVRKVDGHLSFIVCCLKNRIPEEQFFIRTKTVMMIRSVKGMSYPRLSETIFDNTNEGWEEMRFFDFEQMKKEYVVGDRILIEAHVEILEMSGVERKKLRSFDESTRELADTVLIVEEQRFHVSKLFLAGQSSFFKALLLGGFEESRMSEIPLKDIKAEDFQVFLELLHGEHEALTEGTIEGALRLVDMYDVPTARRQCEKYLIKESQNTMRFKLQLAWKYNLNSLKNACFLSMKSAAHVRDAMELDDTTMDPFLVRVLLERLFSFAS